MGEVMVCGNGYGNGCGYGCGYGWGISLKFGEIRWNSVKGWKSHQKILLPLAMLHCAIQHYNLTVRLTAEDQLPSVVPCGPMSLLPPFTPPRAQLSTSFFFFPRWNLEFATQKKGVFCGRHVEARLLHLHPMIRHLHPMIRHSTEPTPARSTKVSQRMFTCLSALPPLAE